MAVLKAMLLIALLPALIALMPEFDKVTGA
jgi:hypothetical protein